jgi:hypothetical protein
MEVPPWTRVNISHFLERFAPEKRPDLAIEISQVFGWRLYRRIAGTGASVLERPEHGHHLLRAYARKAVMRCARNSP